MPWNALDSLDDARQATESFLLPFDRGRWLRLALIAFFVGGGGGAAAQGNTNVGNGTGGLPSDVPISELPGLPPTRALVGIVALVVVVLLLLALLHGAIGAVMEFVLVDGLTRREVHIRTPFRQQLRPGLRLFVFRVLVGLTALVVVAVPVLLVVLGGIGLSPALLLLAIPLVALFALVGLGVALVMQLTTDLAVPTMFAENRGVLDAWRRLLPLMRASWQEFVLYVVVRVVLGVVAGIAVGLVTGLAALVVAVPFVVVGAGVYFALAAVGGPGLAGWVVLGGLAALWLLLVVVVGLFVQVPVVTYFRYYALFFLGTADDALDLVAELRPVPGEDGPDESETA